MRSCFPPLSSSPTAPKQLHRERYTRTSSSSRLAVFSVSAVAVLLLVAAARGAGKAERDANDGLEVDPSLLAALHWRSLGRAVFGRRVVDVAGVPGNPNIIYVANSSGGLWKSTSGDTTFESIFNDGNTLALGAIALDPNNPNVVYAGTGGGTIRNTASYGDGIYKTLDGGETWKHLGRSAH